LSGGFHPVPIGFEDAVTDVMLQLFEAHLSAREVGENHVEPSVDFLEISHVSFDLFLDSTFPPCCFTALLIAAQSLKTGYCSE
jgi:hypothetical protein